MFEKIIFEINICFPISGIGKFFIEKFEKIVINKKEI